jgi:hypothetical protein
MRLTQSPPLVAHGIAVCRFCIRITALIVIGFFGNNSVIFANYDTTCDITIAPAPVHEGALIYVV